MTGAGSGNCDAPGVGAPGGIGPTDGTVDEVHATCGGLGVDALAQPAPLADLIQGTHDRLYSRLFQS